MALTEQTIISAMTILEDGQIQVRRSRRVYDGADMIGERYHREVLLPGQSILTQPPQVKEICAVVWTPDVIAAFLAAHPNIGK